MRVAAISLLLVPFAVACTANESTTAGSRESSSASSAPASASRSASSAPGLSLAGTHWVLTAVNGRSWPVGDARDVTLSFTDRRLGGFNGCNGYGARYTLRGTTLMVSRMVSTLILCQGDLGRVETQVDDVLGADPTVTMPSETELRLTALPEGVLVFAPPSPEEAQP